MSIQKKVIRILLADGNPDGIRIVEVPTETLMITMFPRTQIKQFFDRDEAKKAGIYILFETMDISSKPKIYIGKTENLMNQELYLNIMTYALTCSLIHFFKFGGNHYLLYLKKKLWIPLVLLPLGVGMDMKIRL